MANELFYYKVEHFYKSSGPSWTVTCNFERDEGEVEVFLRNGGEQLKTDSDWQLGEQLRFCYHFL